MTRLAWLLGYQRQTSPHRIRDRRFRRAVMHERLYWLVLVTAFLLSPSLLCILILMAQHVPLPHALS